MNVEKQASIIALANANGIDTDDEGDIFGSTNGALLKFAAALLASNAPCTHSPDRVIPPPPPPPSTRFVRDDCPPKLADREIMEEWDRHYLPGKAKGAPFLGIVVQFARHFMALPPAAEQSNIAGSARERGITNTESGSDIATTTSTVSATDRQPVGYVDRAQLEWLTRSTSDTASVQLWRARTPVIDAVSVYLEGAQKAPEEVRESATDKAIQRAAGELPDGYEVVIELENGAGGVVWIDEHSERHIIEGEGHISDDINEAIDRALEHAAPAALRTSSTDQANADTGSAA